MNINNVINNILSATKDVFGLNSDTVYYKLGAFALLFLALFLGFYYLKKTKMISNMAKSAVERSAIKSLEKKKDIKNFLGQKNNLATKMERKFLYSRLGNHFTFLTNEIWLFCIIAFGGLGCIAALLITEDLIKGLLVGAAISGSMILVENTMAYRNYQKTDENLLNFLNMLGNYSVTTGEVTSVFSQMSHYMENPIRDALNECYYEAQASGDTIGALRNLSDKIEHPKFKEIIKNLEVSVKYSADFTIVVNNNRKIIQDYLKAKQERKVMATENNMSLMLVSFILIITLAMTGSMLATDIWKILFEETVGRICVGVALVSAFCFYLSGKSASK